MFTIKLAGGKWNRAGGRHIEPYLSHHPLYGPRRMKNAVASCNWVRDNWLQPIHIHDPSCIFVVPALSVPPLPFPPHGQYVVSRDQHAFRPEHALLFANANPVSVPILHRLPSNDLPLVLMTSRFDRRNPGASDGKPYSICRESNIYSYGLISFTCTD